MALPLDRFFTFNIQSRPEQCFEFKEQFRYLKYLSVGDSRRLQRSTRRSCSDIRSYFGLRRIQKVSATSPLLQGKYTGSRYPNCSDTETPFKWFAIRTSLDTKTPTPVRIPRHLDIQTFIALIRIWIPRPPLSDLLSEQIYTVTGPQCI